MNEQKLNEKLARWAGFRPATQGEYSPGSTPQPDMERRGWGIMYPDGQIKWYLPSFDSSLNSCFKWLVPKLDQAQYYEVLRSIKVKTETPALAICLAIEKLIDGGSK